MNEHIVDYRFIQNGIPSLNTINLVKEKTMNLNKLTDEEKFKFERAVKLFNHGRDLSLERGLECVKEDLKNRNQLSLRLSKKDRGIHHSLIEKLERVLEEEKELLEEIKEEKPKAIWPPVPGDSPMRKDLCEIADAKADDES
mgnify:CR=1 FL=1|tara:strand:+ start:274 stop:699 length:426 start_codon:yes stop_codon:yes gene_type:complete